MKAMLVCPDCGYRIVGCDPDRDTALKAAVVGLQAHQDLTHKVPMTPDRLLTALRTTGVH